MKKKIPLASELFDYELAKQKVKEQLRSGKSLFDKDEAFASLLQGMLNSIGEGEMEGHLDEADRDAGKRKNGKSKKQLKTSSGTIEVTPPRDRLGDFEPEMIKKQETIMTQNLEDKIIGLYGLGTSLRDISAHIKETYDTDISAATLSAITDKVIPLVKKDSRDRWRSCSTSYGWMRCTKRKGGRACSVCAFPKARERISGLGVMTDLKQRGVWDMLIACIDGLKGFEEATRIGHFSNRCLGDLGLIAEVTA